MLSNPIEFLGHNVLCVGSSKGEDQMRVLGTNMGAPMAPFLVARDGAYIYDFLTSQTPCTGCTPDGLKVLIFHPLDH